MADESLLPHGEALRRAVIWLSEEGRHDVAAVEEACRRFDLTPIQEEFLLRYFAIRPAGEHEGDHSP